MTSPAFEDRSAGLTAFGVLEILIGGVALLLIPAVLLAQRLPGTLGVESGSSTLRGLVPSLAFHTALAAVFGALGIGSIRARRWARTLSLMAAWIWLVGGGLTLLLLLAVSPALVGRLGEALEPGEATLVLGVVVLVLGVALVALPAVFVLFYRSPHVKATCERRDSRPDWTDRCPEPVLVLSLGHALLAYTLLWSPFYNWAVPFFGVVLVGLPGALVILASIACCAWLVRGLYRLRPIAWWVALVAAALPTASAAVTFHHVGVVRYYEAMDYPQEQLELLRDLGLTGTGLTNGSLLAFAAVYAVYLLRVRRHFR